MKQFIPAKLDLDELITKYPPYIENFSKDNLIHIIHLITAIPATNKDLDIINGFVPLYSPILQKRIKNYRQYLDYLIYTIKVLKTDDWYIPGSKSIGYKFMPEYANQYTTQIEILDDRLKKLVKKESQFAASIKKKYTHLIKWYTPDLQIDYRLAMDYIEADLQRKIANPELRDFDSKTKKFKDPFTQYNCSALNIERIAGGDFVLSVDDNVFRLHSSISNLRSDLRNCLSYKGEELVSIDIKNSQPYLSTAILNPKFWQERQNLSCDRTAYVLNISKSIKSLIFQSNNINDKNSFISFIMLSKSAAMQSGSDLQRYRTIVQQGVFYEYLAEQIGAELGIEYKDRKKVKAAVFQVLFTDNRFLGQEEAKPKRIFKDLFPTVYEMFSRIKRTDKTNLPRLLQRLESHLMLLVIAKRIARERPKLPIFTIHDSIVTTRGNEAYVQSVVLDELTNAIGIAPKLSTEYWNASNLKFRDGEFYYGEGLIAV